MIAALSDNAIAIIVASVLAGYVEWSRQRTAKAVAGVKRDLAKNDTSNNAKLDDISNTARSVHFLVNSSMLNQMKISAMALERLAVIAETSKLVTAAADRLAANEAKKIYEDHRDKQMALDARPGAVLK